MLHGIGVATVRPGVMLAGAATEVHLYTHELRDASQYQPLQCHRNDQTLLASFLSLSAVK